MSCIIAAIAVSCWWRRLGSTAASAALEQLDAASLLSPSSLLAGTGDRGVGEG